MKKTFLPLLVIGLFVSLYGISHAQNSFIDEFRNVLSTSEPASANDTLEILESIAGYLIVAGAILAGIAIIVAGIMYMASGSNTQRLTSAKAIFKNGIIGALVLFAAGLIVNTVILLATNWRGFFS